MPSKRSILILFLLLLLSLSPLLVFIVKIPSFRIPSIPFLNQKPFPETVGNLQKEGIIFHNLSNEIGVTITDNQFFQKNWVPLFKKYVPKGAEVFLHDGNDPLNIPRVGYSEYQTSEWFARVYPGSFLADTGVVIATRASDGVREVHLKLKVTNPNPTPETIRFISTRFRTEGMLRYVFYPQNNQPDVIAVILEEARRYREEEKNPSFMLKVD